METTPLPSTWALFPRCQPHYTHTFSAWSPFSRRVRRWSGLARCIDSCGSAKPIDSTGEREQMLSCWWRHVDSSPEASRSIKMSQILNNFIWWRPEMFSLNRWWNQLCWRWANFFFFFSRKMMKLCEGLMKQLYFSSSQRPPEHRFLNLGH